MGSFILYPFPSCFQLYLCFWVFIYVHRIESEQDQPAQGSQFAELVGDKCTKTWNISSSKKESLIRYPCSHTPGWSLQLCHLLRDSVSLPLLTHQFCWCFAWSHFAGGMKAAFPSLLPDVPSSTSLVLEEHLLVLTGTGCVHTQCLPGSPAKPGQRRQALKSDF